MKAPVLSKRMEMVVGMLPEHVHTIADVGCDHAYVSIWISMNNLADNVIAMDVRTGPLDIARRNISEYGQNERIDVRLSDGLSGISPGETDEVIIAGMGGLLINSILKNGESILHGDKPPALILQPQSDIDKVRRYLYSASYHITDEAMVMEDGKYYTVIHAYPGYEEPYERSEDWMYGRCNIENRDKVLIDYLNKEASTLQKILDELNSKSCPRTSRRIAELENAYYVNRKAYERCGSSNLEGV